MDSKSYYNRYEKRIDIDGVADVSMIPKPFHGMVCGVFRKRVTYSVMLDWGGSVVKRFGYQKGVANIYVIDRRGCILKQVTGPVSDEAEQELFREIDRAIARGSVEMIAHSGFMKNPQITQTNADFVGQARSLDFKSDRLLAVRRSAHARRPRPEFPRRTASEGGPFPRRHRASRQ